MPIPRLRTRRSSQPQGRAAIDWANPLAKGLTIAVVPANGLGNIAGQSAFSGQLVTTTNAYGVGAATTTSTSYTLPAAFDAQAPEITVLTLARTVGAVAAYSTTICRDWQSNTGPSYVTWGIEYNQQGNGANVITGYTSIPGGAARTPNYTLSSSAAFHMAAVVRSASSMSLAVNGEIVTTTTGLGGISYGTTGANDVSINNLNNKTGFEVVLALKWDRALSAFELRSLYANPWQLFTPLQRAIFDVQAAAAALALSAAGSTQASGSSALTMGRTLAGFGSAQALGSAPASLKVAQSAIGQAQASSAAALALQLSENGVGGATASATGQIAAQLALLASGSIASGGVSNLTIGAGLLALMAGGQSVATGSVAVSTVLALAASAQAIAGGAATPTYGAALVALLASGQAASAGGGAMSFATSLAGSGYVVTSGSVLASVYTGLAAFSGPASAGQGQSTIAAALAAVGAAQASGKAFWLPVPVGGYVQASDHWTQGRNQLWRISRRPYFLHADSRPSVARQSHRWSYLHLDGRNWVWRVKK